MVSYSNEVATVECSSGLPPGSRVTFELMLGVPPVQCLFIGKIVNLNKDDDGQLSATVRLNSTPGKLRKLLAELFD